VLENVFSHDECQQLIQQSEDKGYEPALLNIGKYNSPSFLSLFMPAGGGEQIFAPKFRKNDRCIIDDEQIADKVSLQNESLIA
jgi:hypothetical protein